MIGKAAVSMAVGCAILMVPAWRPPYTYIDTLIQLVGYIMMLGPPFIILVAVLNKLVNISFTTDYKGPKK